MPASHETPFNVFYSWQSDLPDAVNLKLIRNALSQAAAAMNSDHDLNLHVVIDEATREVPGSPDIADSIFSKIRDADVFVCDLSKVAEIPNAAGDMRKYCNPNVALELGYAVRVLGWNRIIIVFNESYGVLPNDLPFDARGNLVSKYSCQAEHDDRGRPTAACEAQISNAVGNLRTRLVTELKLVSKVNPKRPQELEVKPPEVIKRERDVELLKKVFYLINIRMLDRFINSVLNARLTSLGLDFCDFLGEVVNSAEFEFYDTELKSLIIEFYSAWRRCGQYSLSMHGNSDLSELFFRLPMDTFESTEQERQYRDTQAQGLPLRTALDALLNYVRQNYLEINLAESGKEAVREYLAE